MEFEAPLRRAHAALHSVREDRRLFYARDTGKVMVFRGAAEAIWDLFSVPTTPREALHRLSQSHPLTPSAAAACLRSIARMKEAGVLCEESAPVGRLPPRKATEPDRLTDVYLHLTDRCNLRCLYCYNRSHREPGGPDRELSNTELRDLVRQLAEIGAAGAVFTGGEPLLREDTLEVARYARQLGLSTTLLTNGTLLDGLAGQVAEVFDDVIVSLDSWRAEEQEAVRCGGSFARVVRGIRALTRRGKSRIRLRVVITRHNAASVPEFPSFACSALGCTDFMLALCSPLGGGTARKLLPDPTVFGESLRGFNEALREAGGSSSFEEHPVESREGCGAGASILSVGPRGDVFPCQCLHTPEMAAGNVRESSLREIWRESPQLARFRQTPPARFQACEECGAAKLCHFRCAALYHAFGSDQEWFTRVMCPLGRREVETRLWEEAERRSGPRREAPARRD
jgi:radical SAM protein with 4Fe4S-binding SPASM domain